MKPSTTLAVLLETFFTQRLMSQRQASPHTFSSYRDTFRLLLRFAQERLHKPPSRLDFAEIDAPLIAAFLDDLEQSRSITARSRNLRLTAIRSFFHYAAYEEPSHSSQIQRVLAIPGKRQTRRLVHFLDCNGPRYSGWSGQILPRQFCHGLSPLIRFSWNGPRRQGSATPRQTTARP